MNKSLKNSSTNQNKLLSRMVQCLEALQDLIVISLCIAMGEPGVIMIFVQGLWEAQP